MLSSLLRLVCKRFICVYGVPVSRALGMSDGYFYGLQTDFNSRKTQRKLAELGVEVVSLVN